MIRLKPLLLELSFAEKFKRKNKWIELLRRGDREELKKNLWVLINNSYAPIGGHPGISNVDQVLNPKYTHWEAVDDDTDPEADAVVFGRQKNGLKLGGMGHDGTSRSKSDLIAKMVKLLKTPGYWVEASGRFADVMYGKRVPYVDDQSKVEKIFGMNVKWLDNKGKYDRPGKGVKTLFGRPKV